MMKLLPAEQVDGTIFEIGSWGVSSPLVDAFKQAYQAEFKIQPQSISGQGYDGARWVMKAVEAAGTVDDATKIKAAMPAALAGMKNMFNMANMDDTGDVDFPMYVGVVTNGKIAVFTGGRPVTLHGAAPNFSLPCPADRQWRHGRQHLRADRDGRGDDLRRDERAGLRAGREGDAGRLCRIFLTASFHQAYWAALLGSIVMLAMLGFGVERFIFRPVAKAPRSTASSPPSACCWCSRISRSSPSAVLPPHPVAIRPAGNPHLRRQPDRAAACW